MNECQKRGHRIIKMICDECGQEVNRATFKAPDEWVSIKDSWPPTGIDVLVCFDDGLIGVQRKEYPIGPTDPYPYQGPTHWRPLPPPPKDQ